MDADAPDIRHDKSTVVATQALVIADPASIEYYTGHPV